MLAGSTSQTINVFIRDSTSTTGAGLSGLVFNSSGLIAYYMLPKAAAVAISLATLAAVTSVWSSGGFKEIDATHCPGWYRLDVPDAVLASGRFSDIHLQGATNMAPLPIEIELTATNNQSATAFITGVNSLAPPTNWNLEVIDGSGRLDISKIAGTSQTARDLGASVLLSTGTGTGQLDFTSGIVKSNATQILGTAVSTPATAGILDVNLKNIANAAVSTSTAQLGVNAVQIGAVVPASATIGTVTTTTTATNLTNAPTSGDFTATMKTSLNAATPASVVGAVGSVTGNVGGNVNGSVASVVGAVGSVTGAVGSVTGNVGGLVVGSVASVVADVGITQAGADKVWASAARTLTSFGTLVADVATAVWAAATRTLSAFAFQPTVGGYASGQDPATLVLDVSAASHNIANSIGAKINAAGGAADPWATALPGAYGAGTAGYEVGNMIPLLLKYDFTSISGEANNSVINALRALRRVAINDTTGLITVYKEDGTTPAYTQQGTFDTNALPLQKID